MLYGKIETTAGAVVVSTAAAVLLMQAGLATAQRANGAPAVTGEAPGRTVADLAALCDVGAQDPNRRDAVSYCNGFIVGVGQFHSLLTAAGGARRSLFCIPEPQPTLKQVGAAFVSWTRFNSEYANERAVDGLMRFAVETYLCPIAPETLPRR